MKIPKSVEGAFERKEHPFYMWEGIQSIPEGLEDILSPFVRAAIQKAAKAIHGKTLLHMVGCGTSYFSALAASYIFHALPQIQTTSVDAFEFYAYPYPDLVDTALVGISHTGGTPAVIQSIQLARSAGAVTIGYTDVEKSALSREAAYIIPSRLGVEPALPKTRSYAASLLRHYLLAGELARIQGKEVSSLDDALQKSPQIVREVLSSLEGEMKELAQRSTSSRRIVVVGGGPQWASACEASLKLTEAALMSSISWELEEAVHGAWASTQADDLILILAMEGPSMNKCERLADGMKKIGAHVWVITNSGNPFTGVDHMTRLPVEGISELIMPLFSILPLYQFTYFLALARGLRPDNMRLADPRFLEARMMMRQTIQ